MIELVKKYSENKRFLEGLDIPENEEIDFSLLAQGEYNANYIFVHPVSGEKLLFRVNTGSQMHLENQIEYEYQALKNLESSGRTPKVYYVDGSKEVIPYGVLVMELLPGQGMDYEVDLNKGAEILADIHSTPVDKQKLDEIKKQKPEEKKTDKKNARYLSSESGKHGRLRRV